jgi:ribose/xylose/arabinose/galactoside ABC-type transport system permease subunit
MANIREKFKKISKGQLFWALIALTLIMLFDLIFIKDFFSVEIKNGNFYGRVIDIVNRASVLMILAVGMTFVVATRGIDISVGSVLAISGAIVAQMLGRYDDAQIPMIYCIILALAVTTSLGCWNGFLVAKVGVQPVVATLVLMVAGRGIAQLITSGQIPTILYKPFCYIASFVPGIPLPFSIFIVLFVLGIAMLAVKKTSFGMFVEATGINPRASRFSGINVQKIIFITYAFSGFCAGVAGLISASMIKAADANNAGLLIEMDAILAVAIGGTSISGGKFSIISSIVGALVIQSLTTTMYALGLSHQVLPVIKALVVVAICLIQSIEFRRIIFGVFNMNRGGQHAKIQA